MRRIRSAVAILLFGASLFGCGGGGSTGDLGFTRLRVVNASPVNSSVDFTLDGAELATALPEGASAPDDGTVAPQIEAGAGQLTVTTFGSTATSVSRTVELATNQTYTAYFAGIPGATGANAPRIILANDDEALLSRVQANIRIIHASPALGPVDVYITPTDASLDGRTPDAANVVRFGGSGLLRYAAATVRIRVTATGSKTPLIDVTKDFNAGTYGSLIIRNNAADTGGIVSYIGSSINP